MRRLLLSMSLFCILSANAVTTPEDTVPEQEVKHVRGAGALLKLIAATSAADPTPVVVPDSIIKAAQLVLSFSNGDPGLSSLATQVIDGTANLATVELVINAFDELNPDPDSGIEITIEDLDQLRGERLEEGSSSNLFQGDMMAVGSAQLALWQAGELLQAHAVPTYGGTPWPKGEVKYCFASNAAQSVKDIFVKACIQTQKVAPYLTFTNVGLKTDGNGRSKVNGNADGAECNASPAVYVQSEHPMGGCFTCLGYIPSFQTYDLNLQANHCDTLGTAMHELGHVLGMAHEQSRPDRDEYITVHLDNVEDNYKSQFHVDPRADVQTGYDILSLMHYGAKAASTNGQNTMDTTAKGYAKYTTDPAEYYKYQLGNRIGWTQADADQFVLLYKSEVPTAKASVLQGDKCIDMNGGKVAQADYHGHFPKNDITCKEMEQLQPVTGYTVGGQPIQNLAEGMPCGGWTSSASPGECCACRSKWYNGVDANGKPNYKSTGYTTRTWMVPSTGGGSTATKAPTRSPTKAPTKVPTKSPTKAPTKAPTEASTEAPTDGAAPVADPTVQPTAPVADPVADPTVPPTVNSLPACAYPLTAACACANPTGFDIGYGMCNTYAKTRENHGYCSEDKAEADCAECDKCSTPTTV